MPAQGVPVPDKRAAWDMSAWLIAMGIKKYLVLSVMFENGTKYFFTYFSKEIASP